MPDEQPTSWRTIVYGTPVLTTDGVHMSPRGNRLMAREIVRVLPGVDDEFSTVPPQIVGLDGEQLRAVQFRQDTNNPELPEPASLTIFGVAALALLRRR